MKGLEKLKVYEVASKIKFHKIPMDIKISTKWVITRKVTKTKLGARFVGKELVVCSHVNREETRETVTQAIAETNSNDFR